MVIPSLVEIPKSFIGEAWKRNSITSAVIEIPCIGPPFARQKLRPVVDYQSPNWSAGFKTGKEHEPFMTQDVSEVGQVGFHQWSFVVRLATRLLPSESSSFVGTWLDQ